MKIKLNPHILPVRQTCYTISIFIEGGSFLSGMLTWIEVNLPAIKHNLSAFRKLIGPKILLMPVIKSNAYGHGLIAVGRICDTHPGVDRICVASLSEALELRQAGIKKPIIVLSYFDHNDTDEVTKAIRGGIILPLYSREQLLTLKRLTEKINDTVKLHVKIDTGTSRLGILPKEARIFFAELKKYPKLVIEGLWTHFSSSEENKIVTGQQLSKLRKVSHDLEVAGWKIPLVHAACTASTVLFPPTRLNAVRLGIGTYGLYPSLKLKKKINLEPALSMYTKIIQVKTVPKKTAVGYSRTFITRKTTRLAVLPIGYYEGYDRGFSNVGWVMIRGKKCPVRGRVSMNLTVIDITNAPQAKVGDTVTLLARNASQGPTADMWGKWLGSINYEASTRLNSQIPRIYTTK